MSLSNRTRILLLVGFAIGWIAVVMLSGCATQYADAPESSPNVTFKRNPGFAGWDCKTAITVDQQHVAVLKMEELLEMKVAPGRHKVEAKASSGTCSNFAANYYVTVKKPEVLQIQVLHE